MSRRESVADDVEALGRVLSGSELQAIFEAGAGKREDGDGDGFRPPDEVNESNSLTRPNALELASNFVDENGDVDLTDKLGLLAPVKFVVPRTVRR